MGWGFGPGYGAYKIVDGTVQWLGGGTKRARRSSVKAGLWAGGTISVLTGDIGSGVGMSIDAANKLRKTADMPLELEVDLLAFPELNAAMELCRPDGVQAFVYVAQRKTISWWRDVVTIGAFTHDGRQIYNKQGRPLKVPIWYKELSPEVDDLFDGRDHVIVRTVDMVEQNDADR